MKINFLIQWALVLLVVVSINSQQFVIDEPGIFGFGVDVTFSPGAPGESIILVNSSDVIINCDNNTFAQGNGIASTNGIEVAAGLNNVRIQNLRIQDVTGTGIVINDGCSNIIIENVQIEGVGSRGIDLKGSATGGVNSCLVENCSIISSCTTTSGDAAIFFSECRDSTVKNCIIENSGNSSVIFSAIQYADCVNCAIEGVDVFRCPGLGMFAFAFNSTFESTITNCSARNNNATGGFTGIGIIGSRNFISDCLILRNSATGTHWGMFIQESVILGGPSQSNVVKDTVIMANVGGLNCVGIALAGIGTNINNTFINCVIQSNQATGGDAKGIEISASSFGVIDNCLVLFNTASAVSAGLNFNTGVGGSNWVIRNCEFARNFGSSNANSFGIREQAGVTNLFFNNVSFNNGTTAANQLNGVPAGALTARTTSNLNANRGATNWLVVP